jgi:hypothetical protein
MVTFKLVAVKRGARDLFSCVFCASYSLLVIRYSLCIYSLLIVHLFCSLFDYLFCLHFSSPPYSREKSQLEPSRDGENMGRMVRDSILDMMKKDQRPTE